MFLRLMYFLSWIALTHSNICFVCDCFFVELKTIEAEPEENVQIISFKYKVETLESYNANTTYDLVKKYFYVDCSSDNNVGQINNLKWPKLEILGVLANFKNSQWKKLEFFPDNVKKQMTTLSLSYNLISDVEPFELKEFAVLQMLNLSHNQIETIKKSTYSTLHSLKILDFTGNSINHIDDWAFYGTRLKYLNLARNSLTQLTSNTFRGLNDLSILDLSENRLVKLSEDFGNYLPSLKILTLRGNELKKLPVFPSELKKLDLNGNEFTQLLISHSNLEILDVSRNEISNLGEINIPSLKVIRATYNNLTKAINLTSHKIVTIDLSYNQFDSIPDDLTSDKYGLLQMLNLDGNPIAETNFPTQNEPFQNLKSISLSHCIVKNLPKNSFHGMFPKIKVNCFEEPGISLNFSHNFIKYIDEELFKDFTVCSVDISNNKLKTLSKNFLPWREMTHVDLQKNPWQCDCQIQWMLDDFMGFMYKNHPNLLSDLRCENPQRYKNKIFVFWYNKTKNVFCRSGSSSIFLELNGNKTIEIWTASAIACVALASFIAVTAVVILVLLCKKPYKRKQSGKKLKSKKSASYKPIEQESQHKIKKSKDDFV